LRIPPSRLRTAILPPWPGVVYQSNELGQTRVHTAPSPGPRRQISSEGEKITSCASSVPCAMVQQWWILHLGRKLITLAGHGNDVLLITLLRPEGLPETENRLSRLLLVRVRQHLNKDSQVVNHDFEDGGDVCVPSWVQWMIQQTIPYNREPGESQDLPITAGSCGEPKSPWSARSQR
jgi:hypothetical protein